MSEFDSDHSILRTSLRIPKELQFQEVCAEAISDESDRSLRNTQPIKHCKISDALVAVDDFCKGTTNQLCTSPLFD